MFALINAELETITRGRISRGTLLVKDGRIAALGRQVSLPAGTERIDVEGQLVTPGLIEAHSHAGIAEDGFLTDGDYNEMTDPITPQLLALDGFKPTDLATIEAAESGVTTMYVSQGSANVICGIGAVVKTWAPSFDEQIVAPAAGMKMAMGENPKRVYGGKGQMPSTRMGIAALLRKTLVEARNYIEKKRLHSAKRSRKARDKEPFAIDLKLEAMARLLSGEFPARCHAHRAIDMLTFMRVAEEFKFSYVFEHATEAADILPELKRRRIPVVIGPTMGPRGKVETLRKSFSTVVKAVAAGLTVAITSDHHVSPMKNLPVYAALAVREGLPAAEALKAMTLNPARILGLERRLGSLDPGKDADLVVWNGDPLDVRCMPVQVFIAGRRFDPEPARRACLERP